MYQISAHFVNASMKGAIKLGFSREALLANAGIDPANLLMENASVSHQQLSTLFKTIWKWTEDEFMGLGKSTCRLGYFRLLTANQIRSTRLHSALKYAETHYRVTRDDALFVVEEHGDEVHLIHQVESAPGDTDHLLNEYYLLAWQRYLSWLIKKPLKVTATYFSYPKPKHAALYDDIFSGQLKFGQKSCRLVFASHYLRAAVVRSPEDVHRYVNNLPFPVFSPPDSQQRYSSEIKQLLTKALDDQLPDLNQIAHALEINPRTLHRKLLAEGTRFQELKDRYRYELAIDCLTSRHMNVTAVSDYLGFSEPAAFCHFFKKVAGISPSKYVQLH